MDSPFNDEFEHMKELHFVKLDKKIVDFLNDAGRLLAQDNCLNPRGPDGRSLLSYAAMGDCGKLVRHLLGRGAFVDDRDHGGRTALSWAAEHGASGTVKILLENDADLDAEDDNGIKPSAWLLKLPNTRKTPDVDTEAFHGKFDKKPVQTMIDDTPISKTQLGQRVGHQVREMGTHPDQLQSQSAQRDQQPEEQIRLSGKGPYRPLSSIHSQKSEYNENMEPLDIQALENKISVLEDHNRYLVSLLLKRQESPLQALVSNKEWVPREDGLVRDELSTLAGNLHSWVRRHSVRSLTALHSIPGDAKRAIMQELSQYCNENHWDSLMQKMPRSSNRIQAILVQALLSTIIFERMFAIPFFAFTETEDDNTIPKAEEMTNVYHTMRKVDDVKAHAWRVQTLRMLSTTADQETTSFLQERIGKFSDELAVQFLSGPARLLFNQAGAEDTRKREGELQVLLNRAAQLALSLWTQREFMVCWKEHHAGFAVTDQRMSAHRLHHLDEDDTRLDGKKIFLFLQPAILAYGTADGKDYDQCKVWMQAIVLVDENY